MTKHQKLTLLFRCNSLKRRYQSKLLCFVLSIFCLNGYAQDSQLSGTVRNKEGEPLASASVSLKGGSSGTTTDEKGAFSISVPSSIQKPVLVISILNYQTSEISIDGRKNIEIILQKDERSMDEVIVTGYTNQKKENITGSIGVISAKQLVDVASPNVSNLLQGKVAGVDVLNSSGRPGSTPSVTIRGRSTINSTSSPLWVVDGTIMSSEPILNPNDIESISVLKDASSAALYGSRAANGVIVVTTKTAKGTGERKSIEVSGKTGVTLYNMGNFGIMNSTEMYNYWKSFANQAAIPAYFNDALKERNTDWVDLGSQNALAQDYNLSYSGVTGKAKIYSGINLYDEEGTVKGYDYNRISGRLNLDYKLTDRLTFKPKVTAAFSKNENREHSIYDMLRNMPWDLPYDADGKVINARGNGVTWYGRDLNNYLYDLQWNYSKGQSLNLITNIDFQYDISKHFSFKSTNNISYLSSESLSYTDPRSLGGQADVGRISNTYSRRTTRFSNQMLTYKTSFGEHSLNAIAAYEYNDYKNSGNTSVGKGIVAGVTVLDGAAAPVSTAGDITEYAFRSYLFNAAYSYSNRYSLQFSLRSDGSSRYAKKYATFFAVGGAWNIHNEKFFDVPVIDFLKLRANYGGTGNTPSNFYGYYDLFSVSTQYNGSPSAFPSALGNKELAWEKTYSTDLGLEIGLFKRLSISVDLYNRNTSDLVYAVALPSVSGYTQQLQNIGAVVNKGIEATVSYTIIKTQKLQWNIDVLVGSNKNKVKELYNGQSQLNGNQIYKEGYDINTWYIPIWAGVNPDNGNPQWQVSDATTGNKTVTGVYSAATLQVAGTATPDFFGGVNTNLSYAGLSLKVNTAFRKGSQIYHTDRETFDSDGAYPTYNNMLLKDGWSRWTPDNRNATHPLAYYGGNNNSNKPSTRYLEDGSFFRIRNITLGYSLPESINRLVRTKNIGAYLSFDNMVTITNFSGLDPESISYPQPKRIMLGISIGL